MSLHAVWEDGVTQVTDRRRLYPSICKYTVQLVLNIKYLMPAGLKCGSKKLVPELSWCQLGFTTVATAVTGQSHGKWKTSINRHRSASLVSICILTWTSAIPLIFAGFSPKHNQKLLNSQLPLVSCLVICSSLQRHCVCLNRIVNNELPQTGWREKEVRGLVEDELSPSALLSGQMSSWVFRIEDRPPCSVFLPAWHHTAPSWWAANCPSSPLCCTESSRRWSRTKPWSKTSECFLLLLAGNI